MSTTGDPIWAESILTAAEWKEQSKVYPNVYQKNIPPQMFEGDYKWRHGMGASLTAKEIQLINTRLDAVLKKAGLI